MPPAFATFKNTKEFNAVQFGPGNTFKIMQAPPDFQLADFAFSEDGKLLAVGWASGKIDLWDVGKKKRIADFKSDVGSPGVIKFAANGTQLVIAGQSGKFAVLELPKGKKIRDFMVPLGKFKYDIQRVTLDPNGKWLAYADEESSKVLDLTANPPKPITDLGDASDVSLSHDGSELWTADRSQIVAYRVATWEPAGHWPLKSPPVATASVRLRAGANGKGDISVAVPSDHGLVIYRGPGMEGSFATERSTTTIAFAAASKNYINLGRDLTFLSGEGTVTCRFSLQGWGDYNVSEDGKWLAISSSNVVNVWQVETLLNACGVGR